MRFLVAQWKQKHYRHRLLSKTLYITEDNICWKICSSHVRLVLELRSNHEEADTRVLHAKHAGGKCVIHSEDTDIMILFIDHAHNLGNCYLQKGKGSRRRIVGISEISHKLEGKLPDGIHMQKPYEALLGLHALTGCNTVSAFSSKGKHRPMQILTKNHTYVKTMTDIGKEWNVSQDTFRATEEFIYHLYGEKGTHVDSLR